MQETLQSVRANSHPRRRTTRVPGTMNTFHVLSHLAHHNNPVRELSLSPFPGEETQTQSLRLIQGHTGRSEAQRFEYDFS